MIRFAFVVLILFWFSAFEIQAETRAEIQPLTLKKLHSVNPEAIATRVDLSGLATDGKRLFTVSDLPELNEIYELELGDKETKLKVAYSLSAKYMSSYAEKNQHFGRLDFEGITYCNESFYLVNERARSVLQIKPHNPIPQEIQMPWEAFHARQGIMHPFSGITNAGLEGVACDSENQLLYLFNERQFRMGYVYSLKDRALLHQFDFPATANIPRLSGNAWIYPDFADAHFHLGRLYVLERNSRRIAVVNPQTFQVEARLDYSSAEKGLYLQNDEFGLAEGLVVYRGSLFVVLDNNSDRRKSDGTLWPYLLEFNLP